MKPIHLRCPACHQRIGVDRLPALGELLTCRDCGHRFHFQLKGGAEPELEFNVARSPDGAERANPAIGAERAQPSGREAPESFFERLEREPGAPGYEPAVPRSMPPARPSQPAIGAVDAPPATLSHTSTIGLLLASTAIAFAITAVALIGLGVGALGIGRQTAANGANTGTPAEEVGKIETKDPPAAAPQEKRVEQKPAKSEPSPPAPAAVAHPPAPPAATNAAADASDAVAIIAHYDKKREQYEALTIGWAVDERHFVTLAAPFHGAENLQFVAFQGEKQFLLSKVAFHPRFAEAMARPSREEALTAARPIDVAIFTTPEPIPCWLSLATEPEAGIKGAARVLGLDLNQRHFPLGYVAARRDFAASVSPTRPDRIMVTPEIAHGLTIFGGPILDSDGRVRAMLYPSVENSAAVVVSAQAIRDALSAMNKPEAAKR